jgi:hypothetical protein
MADLTPEQIAKIQEAGKASGMDPTQIHAMTEAYKAQGAAVIDLNQIQTSSFDILEKLKDYYVATGNKLESMGELTGSAATNFGLMATGIAGTTERLKAFSGSMEGNNLGSFSDSVKTLIDNVSQQGTAIGSATEAGKQLIATLGKMGVSGDAMAKVTKMATGELAAYAKNVLMSADNALRFESILATGAAQGGDYNEIYKGTSDTLALLGENLEDANKTAQNYGAMFSRVMEATKTDTDAGQEAMYRYISSIAKIPGGTTAMAKGMDLAGTHTDTLTSLMQFAQGAMLDMDKVLEDVHTTTAQMGTGFEASAKFVARMADVSGDLHAQQKDVHEALFKTTNAFKLYSLGAEDGAKLTQGLADSVKNYARALEAAGVPAQNALEIAGRQITAMEGLSEAQESLISMDTGMGGGIGGALKFEELMSKDPVAASAKMMESMKKRMGGAQSLISRSQAAEGDEQMQQQYMKQRNLLMKGTLGVKAGSKEEAEAMIEQMIKGEGFSKKEDAGKVMADMAKKGEVKEQATSTVVKEANIAAETVRLQAGVLNLGTIQNAAAARTGGMGGTDGTGRGINTPGQKTLQGTQRKGEIKSDAGAQTQMFSRVADLMRIIPGLTKSAATSLLEEMTDKQPATVDAQIQSKKILAQGPKSHGFGLGALGGGSEYTPAHKQVGQAAASSRTAAAAASAAQGVAGAAGPTHAGQPMPVTLVGGSGITVNFTGKCPHCGWDVHTSEQARIQSAPSQSSNKG